MTLRWTAILLATCVFFALGFLYIGSTHRDRCLKAGNVGCTIVPWSGHPSGNWWGGSSNDTNGVVIP